MEPVFSYLSKWSKRSDAFSKVQGVYAAAALILLFGAGLISLLDPRLGQSIAFFALVAGLTFIGNGVIWAITRTFIIPYIEAKAPKQGRKK